MATVDVDRRRVRAELAERTFAHDGLRAVPVDELRLALILFIVVVCVMAATKPAPPRRRASRPNARRRPSDPAAPRRRSGITLNRNAWDRLDLARGVGGDFADPENVSHVPSVSQPA